MKAMINNVGALTDRAIALVEDALIECRDDEVLASSAARGIAREARAVVDSVVRRARPAALTRPVEPRRVSRRGARRAAPQRTIMRDLLVASARVRDITGKVDVEEMSDIEIDVALEQLAALGIVPDEKK
ncbi:hypothetical protein HGI47_21665 [Novosphingobium sp. ERN07]|uniref:hypothetical protein n=1 Tax=Novosphingobium sp. ERN07 TaxID=2726187 RepID=UPI001456DA45|nr:hypothetical protein [Novosphingobium sp. ERN07]NLR73472.1 hypothetical protein [Novosphingobium sp. ERN07]